MCGDVFRLRGGHDGAVGDVGAVVGEPVDELVAVRAELFGGHGVMVWVLGMWNKHGMGVGGGVEESGLASLDTPPFAMRLQRMGHTPYPTLSR